MKISGSKAWIAPATPAGTIRENDGKTCCGHVGAESIILHRPVPCRSADVCTVIESRMRVRSTRSRRAFIPVSVLACAVASVFDEPPRAFAAPPAGYELIFADEFNGTAIDTMKWNYNYPWGDGHTHNHIAWVVPEQ